MKHNLQSRKAFALLGASVAIGALALSGCGNQKGQGNEEADSGSGGDGDVTIALLLPESKTTRYESLDKPNFEKYVAEANPDAKVKYSNANQDATQQQQQVEAAVTEGVDAIVLDPVDASAVASSLSKAEAKKIPVISYDRFFEGADYYTSFDNKKIGNLQGQAVLDGLKAEGVDPKSGPVWMVNGDPKDPNAADFKAGAEETLKGAGVDIAGSHDTLDWNPDDARQWVEGQLQSSDEDPIAIYAANDGTAGGVLAATKKAKVDTVVTGQDAEVDGLQNILKGDQFATIYKSIPPQAEFAAKAAVALASGEEPEAGTTYKDTPTDFVEAKVVTKDTVKDIVGDQIKAEDICSGDVQKLCEEAGVK
ncbi:MULTISPECIES: substrate-binding domain-containing protein [unclassified Brevibacterium]|uniref:substrate-binding domain-containing protein n=1 Tax=unclassified Brevibacterium TaxID=2614124 RepID=UPI001E358444|nr:MULTISPECIES: substrate-binding domain-containing protein [unclassified Brevibacterium]MCD1285601.1 ABC transporter substrate-binding protein [Brevibacterium sp. CCUG 69071]MDK8434656.1 substrate-binding domain-containing protein [Brevibacterium sp. H-BE7]